MTRTRRVEIAANGFRFTADAAGDEHDRLVLLLHGFPQTRHAWRHELPALAAGGCSAIAPDQRGYSAGARPADIDAYRSEMLVDDALALAAAAGHERFDLVGHDWGGQVAWLTAALHPERVRTLTVLSRPHPAAFAAAAERDPEQPHRSRHHRAFQRAEATDALLADGAKRLRGALSSQGVPPADVDAYLSTLGDRATLDAAINWYRAVGGSGIAAADVPAVEVPTLYLWGTSDATVGRQAAEGTAAFVNGAYRFVELPGVGHFITDQAPDALVPELLAHLRAHA